jgi:hypothetical protein
MAAFSSYLECPDAARWRPFSRSLIAPLSFRRSRAARQTVQRIAGTRILPDLLIRKSI